VSLQVVHARGGIPRPTPIVLAITCAFDELGLVRRVDGIEDLGKALQFLPGHVGATSGGDPPYRVETAPGLTGVLPTCVGSPRRLRSTGPEPPDFAAHILHMCHTPHFTEISM
jgi:hypothetical protein